MEYSIRNIGITLKRNTTEFCENPRNWMSNHGGNAAGFLWNTGCASQFLLGAITVSPRVIAASVLNITSASCAMFYGQKSWGLVANAALGIVGTAVTLYPSLVTGDAAASAGFGVFCFAEAFGLLNPLLSKKYAESNNVVLKEIFGSPRRTQGSILFLSRLPVIASAALHGDTSTLIPFCLWASGDASLALSERPKTAKCKDKDAPRL